MDNNDKDFMTILAILAAGLAVADKFVDILQKEISLPNIPMPTMGGEIWWRTIAEYKGWKIQQNYITRHARILNDKNVRIAWGTLNGMLAALKKIETDYR